MYCHCRPFVWGFFLFYERSMTVMMLLWWWCGRATNGPRFTNTLWMYVFETLCVRSLVCVSGSCQFKWQQMITFALFCITEIVIVGLILHSWYRIHTTQYFHWLFFSFFYFGVDVRQKKNAVTNFDRCRACIMKFQSSLSTEITFQITSMRPPGYRRTQCKCIQTNEFDLNKFRRIMINVTFTKVITHSQSSFAGYCSHVVIRHTITFNFWKKKKKKQKKNQQ